MPGVAHHITQRGNRRQKTFFHPGDYQEYLALMKASCQQQDVRLWAYCLMPNHVHLILVPPSEKSLSRAVGDAHRRYTRRVNFREGWRGHLWQGRFASFAMDEPHLIAATRYIERNPVRAKLVKQAEDWTWSSAAAHVRGDLDAWAQGRWLDERTAGWVCSWRDFLDEPEKADLAATMRRHENTGRPLGERTFVQRIGDMLGRDLTPKKPGPKTKKRN